MRDLPAERIDVGQQAIAQVVELHQRVAIFGEAPGLAGKIGTVSAEDWSERSELVHAREEFLISRVLPAIGKHAALSAKEECADIQCPVRNSRHAVVHTRGDLFAVNVPTGADIASPGGCGRALLSRKSRARQNIDSLAVGHLALVLINALD